MRRGARLARLAAAVAVVLALGVLAVGYVHRPPSSSGTAPAQNGKSPPAHVPQSPVLAPEPSGDLLPTPAGLARVLAGPVHDARLGGRVGYSVVDAITGRRLAGRDQARPATPASVTKLVTAAAVLTRPGPAARIITRVVAGAAPGDVVLVGAGDPTLSVDARQTYAGGGRLDLLAAAVRRAARTPIRRLVLDGSAYRGPATATGWDTGLVSSGDVAPITSLMVNGGRLDPVRRARSAAPDLAAGRALARLLGVPASAVLQGRAPAKARELARVASQPMATLVEQMLTISDNVLAEALARQVAISRHTPASFTGAVAAVGATLTETGTSTAGLHLFDGSGLSRRDLLPAGLLTTLLVMAAGDRHPQLRPLLTGLPVAGFTGTLDTRFRTGPARPGAGEVRAKTGTLSGVSALAGVALDADGRLLAFAVLADRVPAGGTPGAETALDVVAATLSRCGCR